MKLSSLLLGGVLCAGILFSGDCPTAMADAGGAAESRSATAETSLPLAPQAGTDAESLSYAQREEQSPEVQEFKGGEGIVIGGGLILLVLLVVLIVVLLRD
jgi:hypothetical protein